jgi:hypothetical protein
MGYFRWRDHLVSQLHLSFLLKTVGWQMIEDEQFLSPYTRIKPAAAVIELDLIIVQT